MKRPIIKKASAYQKDRYDGVYPLYGFVKVDGFVCAIEDLSRYWGSDDPQYEVMAPTGKHFEECPGADCSSSLHTLLCMTLDDVRDRCSYATLNNCK